MSRNITVPTDASVKAYLAAIDDPQRRADCEALAELMSRATGEPARMWGAGIVGFGSYHYRYDSGREGDMCVVGFSSRKNEISVYGLNAAPEHETLLAKLGKTRSGKGCLYIRRMADIDASALEAMTASAARARAAA